MLKRPKFPDRKLKKIKLKSVLTQPEFLRRFSWSTSKKVVCTSEELISYVAKKVYVLHEDHYPSPLKLCIFSYQKLTGLVVYTPILCRVDRTALTLDDRSLVEIKRLWSEVVWFNSLMEVYNYIVFKKYLRETFPYVIPTLADMLFRSYKPGAKLRLAGNSEDYGFIPESTSESIELEFVSYADERLLVKAVDRSQSDIWQLPIFDVELEDVHIETTH